MDIMSILGFILAVVLVLFGMTFDQEAMKLVLHNLRAFIDIPSMAITLGGTIGVMMLSFPSGAFKKIGKHLKIIIKPYKFDPEQSIEQIVEDGIQAKVSQMTEDCQLKLQDTLQKIINDSNGGMICIII